ncbi:hypothetical protein [Flavisolibacter ginsengisoli]|jgi:hypothetical protein|uniref:Uncharacterized protein n=1 Tax=Flavisolibacter ginsengisoli DSM 18119 TaxID=1121884 RepID=A0A1M5BV73_9BACT|nr:hypothetical protein [Flavisolibacter ginsengisoli]SHF46345.1 hypothetical protein SAMN02745131_02692 [Flavisolibacter ginsengisoli DSM 18119]
MFLYPERTRRGRIGEEWGRLLYLWAEAVTFFLLQFFIDTPFSSPGDPGIISSSKSLCIQNSLTLSAAWLLPGFSLAAV